MAFRAIRYRKQGLCKKRECTVCSLYENCGGCNNVECLIYHCSRGIKYIGLTYPTPGCQYREFCYGKLEVQPLPLQSNIKARVSNALQTPKFIPIIKLTEKESWFWPDIKINMIIVKLEDILTNGDIFNEVKVKGLHDYLGYDGHIMLSTIMPDEMIDDIEPEQYTKMIEDLRPDSYMIMDDYTYIDEPRLMSWRHIFRMIERARKLLKFEPPGHPIGLIKGGSVEQIGWCIEALLEMDIKNYAMPCRGIPPLLLRRFLEPVIDKLGDPNYTVILYGKTELRSSESPYSKTRTFEYFSYASMTWYIHAKRAMVYLNGEPYQLPQDYSYYCECPYCQARDPFDLIKDKRALALHNLAQLTKYYKERREKLWGEG